MAATTQATPKSAHSAIRLVRAGGVLAVVLRGVLRALGRFCVVRAILWFLVLVGLF
jgi:hypothetical protein